MNNRRIEKAFQQIKVDPNDQNVKDLHSTKIFQEYKLPICNPWNLIWYISNLNILGESIVEHLQKYEEYAHGVNEFLLKIILMTCNREILTGAT